jgi:membrane protein implicated in regulation of membrane protease activity
MSEEYWWVWMVIGAVFLVGEIFTAAFFLLWFGVGAVVAGLLALAGAGFVWQLAAFAVVSLVLFAASRRFADRFTKKQPPGIGADRFLGRKAIVIEVIDNDKNTGKVRFDKEEWRADSETDEIIREGSAVKVVRVVGTHVVVKTVQKGE